MFLAEDGTVLSKQPVNEFVNPDTGAFIKPTRRPNESYKAWQKRIEKAMLASGLYPKMTYASKASKRELLRITAQRDETKDHLTRLTALTTPNLEGKYDENAYSASLSIPLVESKLNKLNNKLSKLKIQLGSEGKLEIPQSKSKDNSGDEIQALENQLGIQSSGQISGSAQVLQKVKEHNEKFGHISKLVATGDDTNDGIPTFNVVNNRENQVIQPSSSSISTKEESLTTSEKKRPQSFEQRLAEQLKLQGVTGPRQFGKRDKATLNALGITSSDLRIMGVSKFDESTFLRGIRNRRNLVTDQGTIIRTPNFRGPTQTLKIPK